MSDESPPVGGAFEGAGTSRPRISVACGLVNTLYRGRGRLNRGLFQGLARLGMAGHSVRFFTAEDSGYVTGEMDGDFRDAMHDMGLSPSDVVQLRRQGFFDSVRTEDLGTCEDGNGPFMVISDGDPRLWCDCNVHIEPDDPRLGPVMGELSQGLPARPAMDVTSLFLARFPDRMTMQVMEHEPPNPIPGIDQR